jgi:SAM-dependent methyltransferase
MPPLLQPLAHWLHRLRDRSPMSRRHPFDLRLGVDTGGFLPARLLHAPGIENAATSYSGCVPSIVAAALDKIPALDGAAFIDLGCGKGRALLVAHLYPFATITGIEMNFQLVEAARENAKIARKQRPDGPPIHVIQGDASIPDAPSSGDLVYFLYHPFGRDLATRLCARLAEQARAPRRVFVIYENPVYAELFDANPAFSRWFAATLPHAADEIGFGYGEADTIGIWANEIAGPTPYDPGGPFLVTKPDKHAEMAPLPANV